MNRVLTCTEYDRINIVAAKPSETQITYEQAEQLDQLIKNKSIPKGTISWHRNSIKCANYCGIAQLPNLTIEILPKIYGQELQEFSSSRKALISMLQVAKVHHLYRSKTAQVSLQRKTLLDILIIAFCEELSIQLSRGMIREYVSKEENLHVLKGKLLTEMQFKVNLCHTARLFCRYDEFMEDNLANQILKFTLKLLYRLAHSDQTKNLINELLMHFTTVRNERISRNTEFPRIDRTKSGYSSLLDYCKLFIDNYYPDVVAGDGRGLAILFDMNQLFERWVVAKLRPFARKENLRLRSQKPQWYFGKWKETNGGRDIFRMKPDISFLKQNGSPDIIADAKWKNLDQEDSKMKISQSDLYQMQSYANRYEVKTLILFYPLQKSFTKKRILQIHGSHKSTLEIIPVDITQSCKEAFPSTYLPLQSLTKKNTELLSEFAYGC